MLDEVKFTTIKKSWTNLFGSGGPCQKAPQPENVMSELVQIAKELLVEKQINIDDSHDLCNEDVQMENIDEKSIDLVNSTIGNEEDKDMNEITPKISSYCANWHHVNVHLGQEERGGWYNFSKLFL